MTGERVPELVGLLLSLVLTLVIATPALAAAGLALISAALLVLGR